MFKLSMAVAELAHINLRDEKHGEESVPCTDVKFLADVPQSFLTQLHPDLLGCLYKPEGDAAGEQQPLLDGAEHRPLLRFPKLPRFPWAHGAFKAEMVLHSAKKRDEYRTVGEVDKLVLEPKEGGTVMLTFRVKLTGTEPGDVAALVAKRGSVELSINPVEVEDGAGGEGGQNDGGEIE